MFSRTRTLSLLAVSLTAVAAQACGSSKSDKPPAAQAASSASGAAAAGTASPATAPGTAAPTKAVAAAVAVAAPADLARALEGDWADRFLEIALAQEPCAVRVPRLEALADAAAQAGQRVWQAEIAGGIATCLAIEGDADEAVAHLARAVELGFSDCFYLRSDEQMKKLAGRPAFDALLAKIQTSLADVQEMAWTVAEYSAIFHDTNMMVTDNVNRVDRELTVVPQSAVPTRPTSDQSVIASRAMLLAVQRYQVAMAFQSDRSRIEHNTSMDIIDSVGDSPSGRSTDSAQTISRLAAAENAGIRRRAVEARAFKPSGASTAVVACDAIPE